MNTFLVILRLLAYGCVGGVLGSMGYFAANWEFWVIILCMGIVQVTSHQCK